MIRVARVEDIQAAIHGAAREDRAVSVAGGRHAMGGQQFGTDTIHLDTRGLSRLVSLDRQRGIVEIDAGIQWPELIRSYLALQEHDSTQWGIAQKQTGADAFTVAGSVSANAHGRGLMFAPLVSDIESLVLVDANGDLTACSRTENPELFSLVVGGYGLFGVITTIRLRLRRRQKLKRVVEILDSRELYDAFAARIRDGFLYGDFQFDIDSSSTSFLERGVFSCYRPVSDATSMEQDLKELSNEDWMRLLLLTHTDKSRAFDEYSSHYLATSGQHYWSDTHQFSFYPAGYHAWIDKRIGTSTPGTEMISELYVPRHEIATFLRNAGRELKRLGANVVYGTVRLIERDDETFLPWARESFACTVLNLHVDHTEDGIRAAKDRFRTLIDVARGLGGSYFLTYHRWATPEQTISCHPKIREFLALKRKYDPQERFQSDWYRYMRTSLT